MTVDVAELSRLIRAIPDYPEPGVMFRDITPLLADRAALSLTIDALVQPWLGHDVSIVAGIEARGFILAPAVALALGAGFIPIRKHGKLPWDTKAQSYDLEYGTDAVEVHVDAVQPGERVLIVDDVLATGGTAAATVALIESLGADVMGCGFLIELEVLAGRDRLTDVRTESVISYG